MRGILTILIAAIVSSSSARSATTYQRLTAEYWHGEDVDESTLRAAFSKLTVQKLEIQERWVGESLDSLEKSVVERIHFPSVSISSNVCKEGKRVRLRVASRQPLGKVLDDLCAQLGATWDIVIGKGIHLLIRHPKDGKNSAFSSCDKPRDLGAAIRQKLGITGDDYKAAD
jgi:hypothetical protein